MNLFVLLINNQYAGAFSSKALALLKINDLLEYAKTEDGVRIRKVKDKDEWITEFCLDTIWHLQSDIKLIEDQLIENLCRN